MSSITTDEVKNVVAEVLSRRVYLPNASPDAVGVETVHPGQFLRYHVRLDKKYGVLPQPETVKKTYEQTGVKGVGARYLLLGALQIFGENVRATARIVEVETSIVQRAGKGDGNTSAEGLRKAFEQALIQLAINYVP